MSTAASDVDVGALVLQIAGTKLSRKGVRVDPRVTGGTIERTMQGASTLTLDVDDSDRTLLRSGLFDRQIDVQLDGLWYRLVKVAKSGTSLTLTFEDRGVAYLRKITTPRKAARSAMTRAEFALSIVREVKQGGGIPFVCPELHVKQKVAIATSTQKLTDKQRSDTLASGIAKDVKLTVRGVAASVVQRANAQRCLDVAASVNAGTRATIALMQAVIDESNIQNLPASKSDHPSAGVWSSGILQVLNTTGQGLHIDPLNIEECVHAFLTHGFWKYGSAIEIAAKYPSWTTGQVAQGVQGSATPTAYDKFRVEAEQWVNAYTGGALGDGTVSITSSTKTLPYQFQRGGTDGTVEDSWTCLQRLASEVQWACFMQDGSCVFASETTLLKAKPRATLSEDVLGVSTIDFDVDNGRSTSDATVTARIGRLGFPPGCVVVLDGCGPANGRWLVSDVSRGLFDAEATLTLKRATTALPEPAADTTTVSSSSGGDVLDLGAITGDSPVARAYAAAQAMDAKHYPYVWGGGHAHAGTPDGGVSGGRGGGMGLTGYDCSGSTGAILAAAGMGYTLGQQVPGSCDMQNWGEAGEGQTMTLWASCGPSGHVWLEFKTSRGDQHFGTGEWGISNPTKGPRFQATMHFKTGFTPRHWHGT